MKIPYILRTAATATAVAFVVYSCKSNLGVADSLNLDEAPVQTVDKMFVVQRVLPSTVMMRKGCSKLR